MEMESDLTPAEQAVVAEFTQHLGLALRRIVGLEATAPAVDLPQAVPCTSTTPAPTAARVRRESKSRGET